ncbi:hypothetical protein V8B97DRAFT_1921633 [Scleroderma yunnanense]
MFIRASAVLLPVLALSSLVVADSCTNKYLECCANTYQANSANANYLEGVYGLAPGSIPVQGPYLASSCTAITPGGTGSASTCTHQAQCCEKPAANGQIFIGCDNINI